MPRLYGESTICLEQLQTTAGVKDKVGSIDGQHTTRESLSQTFVREERLFLMIVAYVVAGLIQWTTQSRYDGLGSSVSYTDAT